MTIEQDTAVTYRSASDITAKARGREVFLWGASIVGSGMCRALERHGLKPAAFLDRSPRFAGKALLGYPVRDPDSVLSEPECRKSSFIIVTSGHYEDEIAQHCEQSGLIRDVDFITAREINPIDPSVDISGVCNLRCISCPRGNVEDQPPVGFITADTYARVLGKLLREIPFLGSVQLYAWGEPLLNRDLPEIIRLTADRKVLCAISTNLNIRKDFSEVIRAQPDWIKVSTSGFGKSYEVTHTGGNWQLFLRNLHRLRELRDAHHPTLSVEVNYHLYRHNTGDEMHQMAQLCQELGFVFRPNWAYLYPLDSIVDYREGRPLSPEAQKTLDMLLLTIDEGLARADAQAHLPCPEERCLPINWDLSVRSCGSYFEPYVVRNFLDTPLEEFYKKRTESGICERCKSHAIHRFTSVYVRETGLPETEKVVS